jgi:hypothetical protein
MLSSGMLRCVALVRTDVSEELSVSIIVVTRIGELGTTLAVTNNRPTPRRNISSQRGSVASYGYVPSSPILVTPMMEALRSSETSVLTRAIQRNIPENTIIHSHRRENLKSYIDFDRVTPSMKVFVLMSVKYNTLQLGKEYNHISPNLLISNVLKILSTFLQMPQGTDGGIVICICSYWSITN